jgi:hypothetical protein
MQTNAQGGQPDLLDRPLDKFRFGTELEGSGFSNIWFAYQRKSDLYLGARMGRNADGLKGGSTKVSFHGSGVCHVKCGENTQRRWRRPTTPSSGGVHFASVHFPTDLTQSWGRLRLRPDRTAAIISAASLGKEVEFMFFYSFEVGEIFENRLTKAKIGFPIIQMDFPTGEYVHVAVRYRPYEKWVPPADHWQLPPDAADALRAGNKIENISAISWSHVEDNGCLHLTNIQGAKLAPTLP